MFPFNGRVSAVIQPHVIAWLRHSRMDPPTLEELKGAAENLKALKARVAALEANDTVVRTTP